MIDNIWLFGPLAIPLSFGILGFIAFIIWLWALIDCLRSERRSEDKLIWVLVIIFAHIVGAILYLLLAKRIKTPPRSRHLYRSADRRVGGVLGGVAEYLEVDPTVMRVAFILVALLTNPVLWVFIYIISWVIIPDASRRREREDAASLREESEVSTTPRPVSRAKKSASASPKKSASTKKKKGSTTKKAAAKTKKTSSSKKGKETTKRKVAAKRRQSKT